MVLEPIEFSECYGDTPWFRQSLYQHEVALDNTMKNMKNIESQCRKLIASTKKLSVAQREFADTLKEMNIEVEHSAADSEKAFDKCLHKFGQVVGEVEVERMQLLDKAEFECLKRLERFREDDAKKVLQEEKKKYAKEAKKFQQNQNKYLSMKTERAKDFREADIQMNRQQEEFRKASLQYAADLKLFQGKMQFEFLDTLSTFLNAWMNFYHAGNAIQESLRPFVVDVKDEVSKAKERYTKLASETPDITEDMLQNGPRRASLVNDTRFEFASCGSRRPIKEGYVNVQEKKKWTKYYGVYTQESRMLTLVPIKQASKADLNEVLETSTSYKVLQRERAPYDRVQKRFCIDVTVGELIDGLVLQALSEEDCREWVDAMDENQIVINMKKSRSEAGRLPAGTVLPPPPGRTAPDPFAVDWESREARRGGVQYDEPETSTAHGRREPENFVGRTPVYAAEEPREPHFQAPIREFEETLHESYAKATEPQTKNVKETVYYEELLWPAEELRYLPLPSSVTDYEESF
ncbi:unnamed protein product [Cylicocyclus nassatus]|uniref:PH domain-containing protein n=1 Tax=Cylicocyclus nassatus TaxID=53992 RepID=A0AA36GUG1_CYLNA|nr:unnamed protein product [Cylicocyclus nassatus]